jgi:hypothetical protein
LGTSKSRGDVIYERKSSLALKEAAGPGNGDRLIHHPLANAEILVDPLGNFLVFAGNLVALETDFALLIRQARMREESPNNNSRQAGRSLHASEESRDWVSHAN